MAGLRAALPRPGRRTGAVLAALAAVVLAAGCGKGGHVVSTTSTAGRASTGTSTAPASPSEGRPLTAAQAGAFARAVNLTSEDVPGFTSSSKERHAETPAEEALQRRLQRCAGGGGTSGQPTRSSQDFTRRGNVLAQTVSSAVSFAPTAAQAAADLKLLRSAHTRQCLASYLDLLFKSKRFGGAAIRRVAIAQGTPPAPGTAGGFAWRVTAAIAVRGVSVPFYLDILGFVYGPAEVTLQSTGVLVPFPAGAQEQLFSLLLQRARAHPL